MVSYFINEIGESTTQTKEGSRSLIIWEEMLELKIIGENLYHHTDFPLKGDLNIYQKDL